MSVLPSTSGDSKESYDARALKHFPEGDLCVLIECRDEAGVFARYGVSSSIFSARGAAGHISVLIKNSGMNFRWVVHIPQFADTPGQRETDETPIL
jgi:hypothetical protein